MEWNVIVSVHQHHFIAVRDFLYNYGNVKSTDYFNVMVIRVEDIEQFLQDIEIAFSTALLPIALFSRVRKSLNNRRKML
jgi:hypothetical protein